MSKAIYINGINTSLTVAKLQVKQLNELLNIPVELCYNPTYGWFADLCESAYNRACAWGPNLSTTERLKKMIQAWDTDDNNFKDRLFIIAHSQGTAIAANAINSYAKRNDSQPWKVKGLFFAGVNSIEPKFIKGEIFANDKDYVRRYLKPTSWFYSFFTRKKTWDIYKRDSKGHAFMEEYIDCIKEFEGFDGSIFRTLMK